MIDEFPSAEIGVDFIPKTRRVMIFVTIEGTRRFDHERVEAFGTESGGGRIANGPTFPWLFSGIRHICRPRFAVCKIEAGQEFIRGVNFDLLSRLDPENGRYEG